MPAGTYTYVSGNPLAAAGSNIGEVQFIHEKNNLVWSFGTDSAVMTGVETLSGDELEFFKGLYLSDRPVYDWVASGPRDTEGIAGDVAGNLLITITENGKISEIRVDSATTNVLAIVTQGITDATLTVSGATRGQPNLLQSCITLFGSTNGLYLTDRGNVILDEITIGSDEEGVGLKADKIGGDTFIAGTVTVDGTVEWFSRYANIQPVSADRPATLMTNGQDLTMTGANIGRVGRNLNLSTGEGTGGDITIGKTVSTDYGRSDPLPDPSTGILLLSTTGNIIAGLGDVIIGTNTERRVTVDTVGNIQGANVTVKPTFAGTPTDVQGAIGNITATGNIDIELGPGNPGNAEGNVIGNLTAQSGDITFVSGAINGNVGDITAPNGTVSVTIESVKSIGTISGANVIKDIGTASGADSIFGDPMSSTVVLNGTTVRNFDAYSINSDDYFKLRDLAFILSGTQKQFEVADGANNAIVLTSGHPYTVVGGELGGKSSGTKTATPATPIIYLDGAEVKFTGYTIEGNDYFKLRDIGEAFDFGVDWDDATDTIIIDTGKGYTPK
jgi:hypothetical protein